MSMKMHKLFISLLFTLITGVAYSVPTSDAVEDTFLVFDSTEEVQIAKRFRSCPDLHASASGQFSADELPRILRSIPDPNQNIWIVDLRQESHGFIDGLPVSWVTDRNAANADKSAAEISREERALLSEISRQTTVLVHELKKLTDGKIDIEEPTLMIPEDIETEQQLVASFNAKYARIYALDHNKPSDEEVDNFIYFVKYKVKANDWLHFHCRGGGGRASTFITMYDMIRNGKTLTFNEIMQRQAKIGSIKFDAMPTKVNKIWKKGIAKERYLFLCEFYEYVIDPNGYAVRNWSEWHKFKAKQ